jgi:Protein of unknown function (DUF2865)
MSRRSGRQIAIGALLLVCGLAPAAQAEDFFSALFGGFGARPPAPPQMAPPFFREAPPPSEALRARANYGGGQAWCVRTCDGRYFPITGPDKESRAASCHSFCPASETRLVYGSDIDNAATDAGKPYSDLPNAFRYRNEMVAGCTCNGKDQAGLAPVNIDNDPTLRKGDIVAGANGLMVANPGGGKHASLDFTPVPASVRARFQHVPVVAKE